MASNSVCTYIHKMCVGTNPPEGEGSCITPYPTTTPLTHRFVSRKIMTVAVGLAINIDGVWQLMETLERRLKRMTKERDE